MWERSTGKLCSVHIMLKKNGFTSSGVHGDLSRVADGFRCRRCDGTIQKVDLSENLMVDGQTYELLLSGRHS